MRDGRIAAQDGLWRHFRGKGEIQATDRAGGGGTDRPSSPWLQPAPTVSDDDIRPLIRTIPGRDSSRSGFLIAENERGSLSHLDETIHDAVLELAEPASCGARGRSQVHRNDTVDAATPLHDPGALPAVRLTPSRAHRSTRRGREAAIRRRGGGPSSRCRCASRARRSTHSSSRGTPQARRLPPHSGAAG